jgi:hypothetical protein
LTKSTKAENESGPLPGIVSFSYSMDNILNRGAAASKATNKLGSYRRVSISSQISPQLSVIPLGESKNRRLFLSQGLDVCTRIIG